MQLVREPPSKPECIRIVCTENLKKLQEMLLHYLAT